VPAVRPGGPSAVAAVARHGRHTPARTTSVPEATGTVAPRARHGARPVDDRFRPLVRPAQRGFCRFPRLVPHPARATRLPRLRDLPSLYGGTGLAHRVLPAGLWRPPETRRRPRSVGRQISLLGVPRPARSGRRVKPGPERPAPGEPSLDSPEGPVDKETQGE